MKKVLVLDDDLDILDLVKLILNRAGIEVQTIFQWARMGETIQKFHPDLILLDISLGTADGRELCKGLKADAITSHIPVILFSANAEFQKTIDDCHAQGFISKPFSVKHLVEIIKQNL
jgi:DNA-binding response OmpR family regulator